MLTYTTKHAVAPFTAAGACRTAGFLLPLLALALSGGCGGDSAAPTPPTPTTPAPAPAPVPPPEPEPEPPEPLRYQWPVSGNWVTDWIVTNYVDLDPARGRLRDHRGGSITYDGHTGTDITPANFRWMDRGEPLVLAAADGRVTAVYGGEPEDRNTEPFDSSPFCDGVRNLGNYVAIAHEDLSRTVYAHLQHGSVAVAVGDTVSAGDTLGVVGSSGCSTAPHLHFEIVSPPSGGMAGVLLDPYRDELWAESVAPPYEVPFGLRDYAVIRGHFDGGQDGRTP